MFFYFYRVLLQKKTLKNHILISLIHLHTFITSNSLLNTTETSINQNFKVKQKVLYAINTILLLKKHINGFT